MTQILENIFGIDENHPDICESNLWKTLRASDGSLKRLQLPCTSDNRCNVCQYRRSKRLRAYFATVNDLPSDLPTYFVTLTIDPKAAGTDDPQELAEYGKQRFASFRRHCLTGPDMYWARVFEYGERNGRFHIHILIAGNHPFAECEVAPNGKDGRRRWLESLSIDARQTYAMLQGYGFGIYHCERMRSHPGAVDYVSKYVAKSVQSESWVKGTRLVACSTNWPRRYAQYEKRYGYIASDCVHGIPKGSDILLKQFYQMDPMLHAEAMQTDIDFQMADFKMTKGFWDCVATILYHRKMLPRYAIKVPKERRKVVKKLKRKGMCRNINERTFYAIYHRYEESWIKLQHDHMYSGSRRFLVDAIQFPEVFNKNRYDRFTTWFFNQHPKITL